MRAGPPYCRTQACGTRLDRGTVGAVTWIISCIGWRCAVVIEVEPSGAALVYCELQSRPRQEVIFQGFCRVLGRSLPAGTMAMSPGVCPPVRPILTAVPSRAVRQDSCPALFQRPLPLTT